MHSSLILIIAAALLSLVWIVALKRGITRLIPRPHIIAAGLIPFVLVAFIMKTATPRFGDLRVSLEGFRFDFSKMQDPELRVGGDQDADHLVVSGLPAGYLKLLPEDGDLRIQIDPDPQPTRKGEARRFAALRYSGPGSGNGPFHNAVALDDGTQISFDGRPALTWDASKQNFQVTDEEGATQDAHPIPSRTSKFLGMDVKLFKNLPASVRKFPLRFYGAASGDQLTPDGQRLGSFVTWSGVLNRQPWLVLTDPGLSVATPAGDLPFSPLTGRLKEGQSARISLFRLDYRDDRNTRGPYSRAQERRAFTISWKNGRVDLTLDTPSYVQIKKSDLNRLEDKAKREGSLTDVTLALTQQSLDRNNNDNRLYLDFNILGRPLEHETFSAIDFPKERGEVRVTTHTGKRLYNFGDGFLLGEKAALKLRIYRIDFPLGLVLLLLVAALSHAFFGLDIRRHPLYFIMLSGLEFMLAMRLLIAFQAATLHSGSLEGTWGSLLAFITLPYILQAALILYKDKWNPRLPHKIDPLLLGHLLFTLLAQTVLFISTPTTNQDLILLIGFTLIAPFSIFVLYRYILDKIPFETLKDLQPKRIIQGLAILFGALLFFRLFTLLGFGWKERISLGGVAMAVSIYYTPATLLLFAILWGVRDRLLWWQTLITYYIGLLFLFIFIPLIARDLGTVLIFPLPVMLLFAIPWIARIRDMKKLLLAVPFIVYLLLNAVLPFLGEIGLSRALSGWGDEFTTVAQDDPAAAESLLAARLDESRNHLRFWSLAAPDKLREIGTTQAESLGLVMANLKAYGARGPFGEGYLGAKLAPSLRDTHLNDNVSAIHVLSTYGWLGSAAFLFLVGLWALAPFFFLRGQPEKQIDIPTAFGFTLLWTIFACAMYMFAANTGLMLFTGKNVYFLAATSISDLAEGGLLLALILWSLQRVGTRVLKPSAVSDQQSAKDNPKPSRKARPGRAGFQPADNDAAEQRGASKNETPDEDNAAKQRVTKSAKEIQTETAPQDTDSQEPKPARTEEENQKTQANPAQPDGPPLRAEDPGHLSPGASDNGPPENHDHPERDPVVGPPESTHDPEKTSPPKITTPKDPPPIDTEAETVPIKKPDPDAETIPNQIIPPPLPPEAQDNKGGQP